MKKLLLVLIFISTPCIAAPNNGGPDLPYPCWMVRWYASQYTPKQLETLGKQYNISLSIKQKKQAKDCFKK